MEWRPLINAWSLKPGFRVVLGRFGSIWVRAGQGGVPQRVWSVWFGWSLDFDHLRASCLAICQSANSLAYSGPAAIPSGGAIRQRQGLSLIMMQDFFFLHFFFFGKHAILSILLGACFSSKVARGTINGTRSQSSRFSKLKMPVFGKIHLTWPDYHFSLLFEKMWSTSPVRVNVGWKFRLPPCPQADGRVAFARG